MRPMPLDPDNREIAIGSRLRAARQTRNLTIDEVAQISGLTRGFISRIERDLASPSVASLVAICEVLSISIGSLFEQPETRLIRADEGVRVNLGGVRVEERLVSPRGESRVQVVRSTISPGGHGGEELYSLAAEVDLMHVIDGEITVRFPGEEHRLSAGDTISFNGGEPHTWWVGEKRGAEVIWVLVPALWS